MSTLSELLLEPGVFSIGSAAILGAAHALTPGHGKTAVAAYLAGVRGNAFDAVRLGITVTATHTASVFVLGLLAHYLTEQIDLRALYPWLDRTSGLAILAIGLWLLYSRLFRPNATSSFAIASPSTSPAHIHGMGVSGGIVPCPEALSLLILALSRGQSLYGLGLLLSFSLGLAVVLVAIGLSAVALLPIATKVKELERVLPMMSALALIVVGALLLL